ncbi:glycosyltransferase family 4 protein [Xanthomarina spongicola]|uniref:Glycosyltransferase involved in cell wall biosynthesis n=1 Tax=Xanthomarina spongicola TaxID=570520 RepID=A0A316DT17_9FLAO|nr:glycosyltransferase family 4 protein [Xanthomarina spongicola]PWK20592.1 glycosyltransferase involved in cell wall biosynthesis [Xanthomarina spongicola]
MKSILIITSYFPPETGAASNRMFHLANGLQNQNYKVSVITPLPNYPTGEIFPEYKGKFKCTTIENNITIHRLWLYASNSKNKFLRLFAMFSYSFSLIWFFIWNKIPQTVIVQSPPLIVAFTNMIFLRSKNRKLILNVSDLWPIAGLELGAFKKNYSYRLLEKIERFNYKKADIVLGQSDEILTHVRSLIPNKTSYLYRNYPDFEVAELVLPYPSEGKIKLVYAGLLGMAQGIFKLCKQLDYSYLEFHIYGAGAEQKKIETFILNHPELPIVYHGEILRTKLHSELLNYDITIIPLLNRIYGSVPSKIFEYARLGLPILYFGGGEGESIVKKNSLGWTAKAGDYEALNKVISCIKKSELTLEFKKNIRKTALENFDFKTQFKTIKKLI